MTEQTRASRLRMAIEADEILVAPGAYDAITARLVQANGFDAVYMTGGGVANALLGAPDIGLATMTEVADHARRMAEAIDLPLICDVDTGFGSVLNVRRTVRIFEAANVAGIHLEDQADPKRCGHLAGKRLVPVETMVGKLRAALEARRDPDTIIIARTDAAAIEGVPGAIERAGAYARAGADLVFVEALTDRDAFARVGAAGIPAPLLANMTEFGQTPYLTEEEFQELGYAVVIFPMTAFRVMLRAVDETYAHLRTAGTQMHLLDRMRTRAELYELVDYPAYEQLEARYLASEPSAGEEGPGSPGRLS